MINVSAQCSKAILSRDLVCAGMILIFQRVNKAEKKIKQLSRTIYFFFFTIQQDSDTNACKFGSESKWK